MTDASLGGAAPEFVDLHTHSTASDGARAPAEVVRAAAAAHLAALAITDHDTVAGLGEAEATARELGVRIIPGIELSAVEGDLETHLLGLHISDRAELEHRLVAIREMRVNRAMRIVERLNSIGVPVMFDAVLAQAAGGAVGRPHVARALIAGGWCGDFREAFDRYLGNGKSAYVSKERLPLSEAIGLIHRARGIAILAHPGASATRERVAALVGLGLDGLEVLHPSHSWEESRRLDGLVTEFRLVRSGGSDWHGTLDGARAIGMMRVPAHWIAEQEARVSALASQRVA